MNLGLVGNLRRAFQYVEMFGPDEHGEVDTPEGWGKVTSGEDVEGKKYNDISFPNFDKNNILAVIEGDAYGRLTSFRKYLSRD